MCRQPFLNEQDFRESFETLVDRLEVFCPSVTIYFRGGGLGDHLKSALAF